MQGFLSVCFTHFAQTKLNEIQIKEMKVLFSKYFVHYYFNNTKTNKKFQFTPFLVLNMV